MSTRITLFLKIALISTVLVLLVGYSYYQAKDYLKGPTITIFSPKNGDTLDNSVLEIIGKAEHISYLTINERKVFTDEAGVFSEKLLLSPGYNIITVKAGDRFERNTEEVLELVLD